MSISPRTASHAATLLSSRKVIVFENPRGPIFKSLSLSSSLSLKSLTTTLVQFRVHLRFARSHHGHRVGSVALLVARRTNNRKVAGSRPTKVVCITVLTGNPTAWGELPAVAGRRSFFRAVGSWSLDCQR